VVNHACIGHKHVEHIVLSILIHNTQFSDNQVIPNEFPKFNTKSGIYRKLEKKLITPRLS
jgi:hypothetical protein